MSRNLFIPSKIRVGFQKRQDTFTGKLAYVIYYDEKGKIRKEPSWNSWRNDEIETLEIDNDPRNGYIFNKGVKRDGYWGSGRSVIRVYDPRDFEFEISVDNLIGLLMHSDVSKRDIVEECVFAWCGADLVLLPTNSQEYADSLEYTSKQSMKVSARDLVLGRQYGQKKHSGILTYIGRHEWYVQTGEYLDDGRRTYQEFKGKKHIFADGSGNFYPNPATSLSHELSDDVVGDIAHLVDKYYHTRSSQKVVDIVVLPAQDFEPSDDSSNSIELHKHETTDDGHSFFTKVYLYYYYHGGQSDKGVFELDKYNMSVYLYAKSSDDNGVISMTNVQDRYQRGYSYRETDIGRRLRTTKETLQRSLVTTLQSTGHDITKVTQQQIYEALVQLGFGQVHTVLENGNTYKFNL